MDLLDSDGLRARLHELAPDAIVHSAAIRFPDQVEADPEGARRMNVHVSQVIAEVAGESRLESGLSRNTPTHSISVR